MKKFQAKEVVLKNGVSIVIKAPSIEEAGKLIALKRDYIMNTTTIPMVLDEYPNDPEKEKTLISKYNSSKNSVLLVAEFENKLIGNIDITGNQRTKMFHTAMLGMGIKEAWRNKGLGRALIESALLWTKNHSNLEIVWLNVYSSNELGLNLYLNTGFNICGKLEGFFKEEEGYKDKIQMYQRI